MLVFDQIETRIRDWGICFLTSVVQSRFLKCRLSEMAESCIRDQIEDFLIIMK
jgi:hypothetical protein